jgi:dTDP-4-amino-4,6-dideoxygalactose transaminase
MSDLVTANVETAIGTHHIPLTDFFRRRRGYSPGDFPATDDVAARALALPMHHHLSEEDQNYVAEVLRATMLKHLEQARHHGG